jgi:hypothetical protein
VLVLCVSKNGSVKAVGAAKSCARGGRKVPVNERGAAGARGPAGVAGPPGASGIAGAGCASDQALQAITKAGVPTCASLHAYSAPAGDATQGITDSTAVAVPAGSWVVMGQAQANNADSFTIDFECRIQSGSTTVDDINQNVATLDTQTITPVAATTTTGPSTVLTLLCTDDSARTNIGALQLVAVPAAALN